MLSNIIPSAALSSDIYGSSASITVIANNTFGQSASMVSNVYAIFDGLSITLLNNIPSSCPTLSNGVGCRVWSGSSNENYVNVIDNTIYANLPYENSSNITSAGNASTKVPNQELPIFKGAFRTPPTSIGYNDYSYTYLNSGVNYYGITQDGYRFATFAWRLPAPQSGGPSIQYNNLVFTLNGLNGTVTYPLYQVLIGNSPLYIFWRFQNGQSTTPSSSTLNPSSQWINGSYYENENVTNGSIMGNPGLNLLYGSAQSFSLNRTQYMNSPSNVFPQSIPVITIDTSNIYVYCRIGLPMSVSCSFTSVSMSIYK